MMYSGDDYYGDEISSGAVYSIALLSAMERTKYIDALSIVSEYTREVLLLLDDIALLELAEDYDL